MTNYSKPTNECPVCGGEIHESGRTHIENDLMVTGQHFYYHLLEEMAQEEE